MQRETIEYNGFRFIRYPESKSQSDRSYYRGWIKRDGKTVKEYLHRYMWECANGPIPKGYDVHHIDGNHDNNTLDNFALVLNENHVKHHHENISEGRKAKLRKVLEDNRQKAADWHKSEEGRKWHSQNSKKQMENREYRTFKCIVCGREFTSRAIQGAKFCSNSCKSKWRRDNGLDDVERTCRVCGAKFKVNKYSKKECCSKRCAALSRWRGGSV